MCTHKHIKDTSSNIHSYRYRETYTQTNITLKYPSISLETNEKNYEFMLTKC